VNDDVVVLEMTHAKVRLEFSRWAVGSVTKKQKDDRQDTPVEVADSLPDIENVTKSDK
jgi:hypothetical protein